MKKYKRSTSSDTAEIISEEDLDNWSSMIFMICKILTNHGKLWYDIHLSYEFLLIEKKGLNVGFPVRIVIKLWEKIGRLPAAENWGGRVAWHISMA